MNTTLSSGQQLMLVKPPHAHRVEKVGTFFEVLTHPLPSQGFLMHKRIIWLLLLLTAPLHAQQHTVGLLQRDTALSFTGYTLFAPIGSTTTYLVDENGLLVHSWLSSYRPGQAVMFLPNGNLLRTAAVTTTYFTAGGAGGRVESFTWDGTLEWSYEHFSSTYRTHHDIEYLPNGNVLLISWELKSVAEAIAAGRNPANIIDNELWPEKIIEVQPIGSSGGTIVWEWHAWDHLIQDFDSTKANYGDVAQHPELIDLNFGTRRRIGCISIPFVTIPSAMRSLSARTSSMRSGLLITARQQVKRAGTQAAHGARVVTCSIVGETRRHIVSAHRRTKSSSDNMMRGGSMKDCPAQAIS